MNRPNLFLVGAPKSGTTALYTYLGRHPQIFMSPRKELHYFGDDLEYSRERMSEARYLSFFSGARDEKWRGEGSVFSLYSQNAAAQIAAFSAEARIIVMLRDPVEMVHALHGENLFIEREDIWDFAEALAAEPDRSRGQRIPRHCTFVRGLFYRKIASYPQQLRRFLDVFGSDRVHVILFDDFKRDPAASYRAVLDFLGVDSDVDAGFEVINASHSLRSPALRRFYFDPPLWAKLPFRILPLEARARIARGIRRLNARPAQRPPIPGDLAVRLRDEFADEVRELGVLIGRDLTHWSETPRD